MQNKPSKWVSGYKHGPAASYTQITRMGLFLNVATSKFEPLDSTWDNLHSGGMFISGTNKIYFRDETNKDIYINSPADNQLALYASSGVGVNVTPAEMLHVVDATAEGGVLIDNTATDGNPILAFGLSGTKTFTMGIDDGDSDKFKIFSGAAIDGTSEFVIDGSGNVGIGTATPNVPLEFNSSRADAAFAVDDISTWADLKIQGATAATRARGIYFDFVDDADNDRGSGIIGISGDAGGGVGGLGFIVSNGNVYNQAMNIAARGNVGIGVTPEAWEAAHLGLQLGPASALWCYTGSPSNTTATYLGNNAYYDGAYKRVITDAGSVIEQDSDGSIKSKVFVSGAADSAITFIDAQTIDVSGNITVNTGNLVVGTAGKGIDFSAQTATSATGATTTGELLNHYETGTWTGTITDGSNDATMEAAVKTGQYTRIGNTVTVSGMFQTSSLGSMTGSVAMSGLPFAVGTGDQYYAGVSVGLGSGLNLAGAGIYMSGNFNQNSSIIYFRIWDATTGTNNPTAAEWSADGKVMMSGTYFTS